MPSKDDAELVARSRPYPETRATVWVKSLGMFLVGIATVLISYAAVRVQRSIAEIQRTNGERDIQLKQDNARFQEKTEAARLAASLVQFLKCPDDLQRTTALRLLAPDHAKLFAEVISDKCTNLTPQAKNDISRFHEQSTIRERVIDFQRLLANAREFKNRGFDGPASRLFDEASGLIQPSDDTKINKTALARARKAFADGRFSEAADLFVIAFVAIPEHG
jgi:hypothetical protein